MPLDFQLVQAPFRFGVDEGTDPKQVPFGTLLTAENVVWKKSGRLEKRYGVTSLTSNIVGGGSLSSASRMFTRGDELCLVASNNIYSYTSSGWVSRGEAPEVGIEWETLRDDIHGIRTMDMTLLSNGNLVTAWVSGTPTKGTTGGRLMYQITDRSTGTVITSPTEIASSVSFKIRVISSGNTWVILWTTSGNLYATTSTGNTTLQTDIRNSLTYGTLDACVIGTDFVVGYCLQAGGLQLRRYSVATTPVLAASGAVSGETSTSIDAISLAGVSGQNLWVTYSEIAVGRIRAAVHNPSTMASTVAPVNLETSIGLPATLGAVATSNTTCMLLYSFLDGTNYLAGVLKSKSIDNAGAITTGAVVNMGRLLSRPFALSGRYYALAATQTLTAATPAALSGETFLIEASLDTSTWMSSREVGKIDWLVGGYWADGYACEVVAASASEAIAPSPYVASAATTAEFYTGYQRTNSVIRQGAKLVSMTIGASAPKDMWRSVTVGAESYLAAGSVFGYDGVECLGIGWAHPFYINAQSSAAGGGGSGTMDAGNYIYNVLGERRSAASVLHRSPVGSTYTVTAAANGSVALQIVPQSIGTSALSGTTTGLVPIYRTVLSGSIPQRLTVEPLFNVLYNEPASYMLTLTDTANDTDVAVGDAGITITLVSRPAMYTEGGELDDWQPPSVVTLCQYRNRLFAILGDRSTLAFTKSVTSNPGVAPGFNPQQRIVINDRLTGLQVLDERLIIFSESSIYHIAGDGPSLDGSGSDYGEPNRLQTDVGCTNPRGLVTGPDGVFFVSGSSTTQAEIHMLDRGLNVQWIGKPVQDRLDSYPNVTSAVLVSDQNQVRFSCQAADGLSSIVLVYDYVEKQWSHFVYGATIIADACIHGGVYTFVTTSGVVYKESAATHLDAGSWVTAKLETAWIHATGPLAYHSVRNFRIDGVSATAHGLSISVGFDGDTTYQQGPETWAEGVSGVTSPGDSVTASISVGNRRKCRSIRFKVQDSAPVTLGTGQGPKWSSMGIEVGAKRGLGRLAERQKG